MKNRYEILIVGCFAMIAALGCGYLGGPEPAANSNRSVSDRAIDSTVGRSNVGIPECDQVLNAIETELNSPDDNFVVKAAKAAALNRIKENIRQTIEQNTNKNEVATACREFKTQLDKYKADPNKNTNGGW
jgi:hypothetical protein